MTTGRTPPPERQACNREGAARSARWTTQHTPGRGPKEGNPLIVRLRSTAASALRRLANTIEPRPTPTTPARFPLTTHSGSEWRTDFAHGIIVNNGWICAIRSNSQTTVYPAYEDTVLSCDGRRLRKMVFRDSPDFSGRRMQSPGS